MRGWGVEELIFDINNDPRVLGRILYFDNLSDQDVAILYKHCLLRFILQFMKAGAFQLLKV